MAKSLTEVDGTIPGRAALITINLGEPGEEMTAPQYAPFVEGEYNCTDPDQSARGLWESIKDDFPGHSMAVVLNERAKYLAWARRIREVLGADYESATPARYLND